MPGIGELESAQFVDDRPATISILIVDPPGAGHLDGTWHIMPAEARTGSVHVKHAEALAITSILGVNRSSPIAR